MAVHAELRRNATLVGFAGVAFFALQVAAGGLVRVLGPAEVAALPDSSIPSPVVRLAAALLASAALVVAFRAWVRPAGRVAAAGAGFFAVSWLPVVVASQVSTSLYAALAAVAASGFVTRWLIERDRGALVAMAAATALVCWWEPPAGGGLAASLVGVLVVWGRAGAAPGIAAVVAGGVGGGLVAAALPAGALRDPLGDAAVPWAWVLVTVVVVAALVGVAVVEQRWPHRRNAAVVGCAVAAGMTAAVALQGVDPVSLLPALGVLSVSVGSGTLAAWHAVRRMSTPMPTVLLVAAAVAVAVGQLVFAVQLDGALTEAASAAPASG